MSGCSQEIRSPSIHAIKLQRNSIISGFKSYGSRSNKCSVFGVCKVGEPLGETKVSCHASSFSKTVLLSLSNDDYFEMVDQMVSTLQVFCSSGSGFIIESLDHLDININRYKPIKGSSFVPTPPKFLNNHFLLNIQNKDQMCFAYSILAALNPSKAHTRQDPKNYKKLLKQLDLSHCQFPMSLSDIPKFGHGNSLAINVFGLEQNEKVPLFLSKHQKKRINLLLITDGVLFHYCLLTNFNAFMTRQYPCSTNRTKFCERCLHGFSSLNRLTEHLDLCGEHDAISIKMPLEGSKVRFKHYFKTLMSPFGIYADTEALCSKQITCGSDPSKAGTTKLGDQIACSFGALLVDRSTNTYHYEFNRGQVSIAIFFDWVRSEAKTISQKKQSHKQLVISEEERKLLYATSKKCVICDLELVDYEIVHHDHATGKIFDLAHNKCNLRQKTQSFTPVFFTI